MPNCWVCDQAGLSSLRHQGTLSTFIYYIATSNISDGTKICLDDANNWFSPYNPGCFGNIQMDGLPLCAVFPCLITFKPLYFSHFVVLAFLQEISCKLTFVVLISSPSCSVLGYNEHTWALSSGASSTMCPYVHTEGTEYNYACAWTVSNARTFKRLTCGHWDLGRIQSVVTLPSL